jgi:putative FmdB family regulatory protein
MPLYEYRCDSCGHRFEVLQRLGEDGEGLLCPHCEAPRPSRQLSTFATSAGGSSTAAVAGGCGAPGCGTGFS